ncbi:MAG TPA: MMPL family transporter, partial [Actinomycetota bacterium]|nr:MMPL family transporter [Actinomycetota bacterium]
MLERIADLTWRRPKLVLGLVALFMVVAVAAGRDVEQHLKAAGFADSESESERATALLRDALGYDANPGIVVLVRAPDGGRLDVRDPGVRREVGRISSQLAKAEHVGRVVDPVRSGRRGRALIARDGHSLVITGHLSTQDVEEDGGQAAEDAQERIASDTLDVSMGGFAPSFNEVNDQTRSDLTKAELIAFPVLAVLLLLVFRGVVAAGIPLLIGVVSILGTFLVLRVMATFVDTSLFALNIATGLSLGLAVDYALLLVSRYREELEKDGATRDAHRNTVLTAGRTTVFSGFTVAVAMAALGILPQRFLYSMAVAGAAVALLSALIAILVVPSLLSLLGDRVNALAVRRGPAVSDESTGWYRLARGVMRRPLPVALATFAVLIAAAVPLLSTVLTGPSAEAVPPTQPSYDTNEYVEAHYARGVVEAMTITVDGRASDGDLKRLSAEISAVDGAGRAPPFTRASEDVAFVNVAPEQPALSRRSQDAVDRIRELDPPRASSIVVSGNTARFMDQKQSLADHLPLVVAIVAAATFVLLFLLTGSIILP